MAPLARTSAEEANHKLPKFYSPPCSGLHWQSGGKRGENVRLRRKLDSRQAVLGQQPWQGSERTSRPPHGLQALGRGEDPQRRLLRPQPTVGGRGPGFLPALPPLVG